MSKKKEIHSGDLVKIEPITDNQKLLFEGFTLDVLVQVKHLYLYILHYKMFLNMEHHMKEL